MMRRLVALVGLLILGTLGAGIAPGASHPAAPRSHPCYLGQVSGDVATIETSVLARARASFERSLTGASAGQKTAAGARFVTDLAAYVYGFPVVIQRRTTLSFPRNQIVSIGKLADTSTQSIVAPNHDTLYSVAQVDLRGGPMVIHTPPTGGRYSVIQLIDGFTNAAAYLGDGAAARPGETAVLVAPGWRGAIPAGLRVVHPATSLLLLLGRTLATGPADTAAAVRLLKRYSLTPLSSYLTGGRTAPLVLPAFPKRPPIRVPTDASFFTELGTDLAADPPPAADRCAIKAFAAAGVGPARMAALTGLDVKALTAAASAGSSVLATLVARPRHEPAQVLDGWAATPPDTAQFGTEYLDRAFVAVIGLEANTNAKALYLTEDRDARQRPLSGAHVYRLRFHRGQLPPVSAFWSLTLYNRQTLFYANALNRFTIGNRTAGLKRDRDGGLTIIVSHRAPGAGERSNWLPAPAGAFSLYLRLFQPQAAAVDHRWVPPPVVRSGR